MSAAFEWFRAFPPTPSVTGPAIFYHNPMIIGINSQRRRKK